MLYNFYESVLMILVEARDIQSLSLLGSRVDPHPRNRERYDVWPDRLRSLRISKPRFSCQDIDRSPKSFTTLSQTGMPDWTRQEALLRGMTDCLGTSHFLHKHGKLYSQIIIWWYWVHDTRRLHSYWKYLRYTGVGDQFTRTANSRG